jgi:type VI secretion system secreted protein Hcp
MDGALRASIRRSLTVALVVTAIGVGFVAHGVTGSKAARPAAKAAPRNLTKADLLAAAATATAGIYMQFDGISGPPAVGHSNHIAISSFQFGVGRGATIGSGTRSVSAPSVSEITVTHQSDKYSVPLANQSLRGDGTGNAIIYIARLNVSGKIVNYLEFDLGGALVTSYSLSSAGENPSESFSLNFTSITMKAQYVAGGQTVSWNLLTGS